MAAREEPLLEPWKRQSLERLCRFYPDDWFSSTLLLGYNAARIKDARRRRS